MPQQSFVATIENLPSMVDFLAMACQDLGADPAFLAKMDLATEEALVNVIHYAYPASSGELRLAVARWPAGPGLEICLEDEGIPFNPLEKKEPELELPPELRPMGGLGIFLIRKNMDEVLYERRGDTNVLTMRKRMTGLVP